MFFNLKKRFTSVKIADILKILKEISILRLILGYTVGITVFLFLLPLLFIKVSLFLDRTFVLSPFLPLPLGWLIALPIVLFGLFWALWSNVFLLIEGRGGPVEGFGIAISPPTKKLVVKGPYRYTRNPMVFGTLTIYLGIGFYISSPTYILFVLPCFWLATYVILTVFEEKRLVRDFDNEYIEYKRQVPMYFPWAFFLKTFRKNS